MPIFHPAFYCIQGEDSLGAKAFEMVSCARFINPAAAHETDLSILNMEFDPCETIFLKEIDNCQYSQQRYRRWSNSASQLTSRLRS
jgi:hypothetical protein